MNNVFYVYIHRRNDNNEVFYVGKGKDKRSHSKAGRNQYWLNIVNKHGYSIEIVEKELSEDEAFDLEVELIKFYRENGHKLTNLTDGGEGTSGYKLTRKERARIRQVWEERVLPEVCQPFDCKLKLSKTDSWKVKHRISLSDEESVKVVLANIKRYGKVSTSHLWRNKGKISVDRINRATKFLESIGCIIRFMAPVGTRLNGVYSFIEAIGDKENIVELFKSLTVADNKVIKNPCKRDGKYPIKRNKKQDAQQIV